MALTFGFGHVPASHYRKHVELVQLAERLGYDRAWIADQTFYRDPYAMLAALALSTDRIGLGLGVTNPFTRHPAIASRAIATVAEMAPGRVALGVGAGNVKELLRPLGLDDGHVAARCREMVELVRLALTGEPVQHDGAYFRMQGARLELAAGADVPLYLAGRGARVLEAAGEIADGVLVGGLCSEAGIAYALDRIRTGAARAGRGAADVAVGSWVTCYLTDDRERAIAEIAPTIAHIIGGAPDQVLHAIGLPEAQWRPIKAAYDAVGIPEAAAHVTADCADCFTIVGDAKLCVERIRMLERAGIAEFILLLPTAGDAQVARLEHFADAVLPAFR